MTRLCHLTVTVSLLSNSLASGLVVELAAWMPVADEYTRKQTHEVAIIGVQ